MYLPTHFMWMRNDLWCSFLTWLHHKTEPPRPERGLYLGMFFKTENIIWFLGVNGHALFVNVSKSLWMPKAQQVLRAAIQAISGTSGGGGQEVKGLTQSKRERGKDTATGKPLAFCWAASDGHATTLTTLSTLNLRHMFQWLCNPILAKTPMYYLLRENDGYYHKVFPSSMSFQSPELSPPACWEHLRRVERRRRV